MNISTIFDKTPAQRFQLSEKRTGIYQLIAPLFHEDGDMMNIYLSDAGNGQIMLSDEGMSLMRLSYTFDLDTDNKVKLFEKTLAERHATNDDGNICMVVPETRIYPAIMEYSQLINTVCNFDLLSRENVSNLFYDSLHEILESTIFDKHSYKQNAYISGYNDMNIDYLFENGDRPPLCLFGVKDTNKAQQVTICCLQLAKYKIPFRSAAVFEDMDKGVTKFARNSLVNTVGKTFTDLKGFEENGLLYLDTELSA